MPTLSPALQYTSRMRVLMGEFIISSNAGATLPVALTEHSMVPRSTVDIRRSFFCTEFRSILDATSISTMKAAHADAAIIIFLRLLRMISSLGISLSIVRLFISAILIDINRAKNIMR